MRVWKWLRALAFGVAAVAMLIPGAVAAQSSPPATQPTERQEPDSRSALVERALESRSKGPDSASVVVFEIADFQCPYCAQFATRVEPQIDARYVQTGKVQWVFVNLPLQTHPLAWNAAEAALCTGAAGGSFWTMHDRLYGEQGTWSSLDDPSERFAGMARDAGASPEEYDACVARDQVAPIIIQDLGSAISAGIGATPTFVITSKQKVLERIVGVQPIETWTRTLDLALQGKSTQKPAADSTGDGGPG